MTAGRRVHARLVPLELFSSQYLVLFNVAVPAHLWLSSHLPTQGLKIRSESGISGSEGKFLGMKGGGQNEGSANLDGTSKWPSRANFHSAPLICILNGCFPNSQALLSSRIAMDGAILSKQRVQRRGWGQQIEVGIYWSYWVSETPKL